MSSSARTCPWFAFRSSSRQARLRLFCLPFGGGSASIYRTWADHLPGQVELCPLQLPGRENRIKEVPFTGMAPLIEALSEELRAFVDLPFAIFGHSLGAVVGFELAQRLWSFGKLPVHLIVSAHEPPSAKPRTKPIYSLPDRQLIDKLRELGGTPKAVLEDSDMLDMLLPMIRADFEINDTYVSAPDRPLECPITVLGASDDREVKVDDLKDWSQATRGPFRMRIFEGEHFYILDRTALVVSAVSEILADYL